MKEFREDKKKLEENLKILIEEFNNKHEVTLEDIDIIYVTTCEKNEILKINLDIKI